MSLVKADFEAELPFWLCMDDDTYEIFLNGIKRLIVLDNNKWLISMGNELDGQSPEITIAPENMARNFQIHVPDKPYYHKQKLKTVLNMGFKWEVNNNATDNDAKETFKKHFNWCTKTYLQAVNKFIEIYRLSGTVDKIPTYLDNYELCNNWWYILFLDNQPIERVRIGLDIYPVIRKPPFIVKNKIQEDIKNKLKVKYTPPPYRILLENGQSLHRRGKYRMAVVEIYSGFESFLIKFIREKYKQKGYESELIEHLMHLKDVNFMLTIGLKLSIGKSFKTIDGDFWTEWTKEDGVQALRRDIIHHNRTTVFKKESENAIKVVKEMIKKILEEK